MKKLFAVLVAACVVTCFFGCTKVPTTDITYDVSGCVLTADGVLADVDVLIDGEKIGVTDSDGSFEVFAVKHGSTLTFEKEDYVFPKFTILSANRDLTVFGIKVFVPTVLANDESCGTVNFKKGDSPNVYVFEATPNEDYVFTNWLLDGEFCSSSPCFEITLTKNSVLTACFEKAKFEVVVVSDYAAAVSGAGKYPSGKEAILRAIDTDDAEFCGWFLGGTLFSEEHELTITVNSDVTFEARFLKRLKFDNFSLSRNTLFWSAQGAEKTDIFVDGKLVLTTTEFSADLSSFVQTSGTYIVKAVISGSGRGKCEKEISFVYKLPVSTPYDLGAEFSDGIYLSFLRINSAVDYEIFVGDKSVLVSEHPSLASFTSGKVKFKIDDFLTVGNRTEIYVVAKGGENRADSLPSNSIFVVLEGKLSPPSVTVKGTIVSWEKTDGVKYYLSISGVLVPTNDKTEIDLLPYLTESGTYEVIVTASAENYKSASTKVYVTK